jgi:putative aldouronate transport system substrate-binding protein
MKRKYNFSVINLLLLAFVILFTSACGYEPDYEFSAIDPGQLKAPSVSRTDEKFRDVYGTLTPYEDEVTITVAAIQYDVESGVKPGTTPENQAFNKLAKEVLNINLKYTVVGSSTAYDNKINLAIAAGNTPDMFYTTNTALYSQLLDQGRLADLSDSLWYLNDDLLDNYLKYSPELLPTVMKDGGVYSFPAITNKFTASQRLYIRRDWLDIAEVEVPTNIDQLVKVGEAFLEHKDEIASKTGISSNRVIPFTMHKEITWAGSFSAEGIFNSHGASLNSYFEGEDGDLYFSNTSVQAKNTLATLSNMYKKGILDQEFLSKTSEQISANIKSGYVGMIFGEWWLPKDALDGCISNIKGSDWVWVDLPSDTENTVSHPIVPSVLISGYNLVSKECKYPEAAAKLINLFYDVYYNDNAVQIYGQNALPSNGFYHQTVPIKLWDGAASLREYKRVQKVFNELYDAGFDPADHVEAETYKQNALYQTVSESDLKQTDYQIGVITQNKDTYYNILNRAAIAAIEANPEWKEIFNTLRTREKTLHFADGYPYFVRFKNGKNVTEMTTKEKAGWGIYHEMVDIYGSYAYVSDLSEGLKEARYNKFYGPTLSAMNDYAEYLNTQANVIFTKMITGSISVDAFETEYVEKVYNNNGGTTIMKQVNAWYDSQKIDLEKIYANVK